MMLSTEPIYRQCKLVQSFPTMRLWGSIEDKLVATISNIWLQLLTNPTQDIDECLRKHLDPLANRLNMLLEN